MKIIPVILCGGAGARMWPISRKKAPKQFHNLASDESLFHETLVRSMKCAHTNPADIITVTSDVISKETIQQLGRFSSAAIPHMIVEPESKNTAAAVAYATFHAEKAFGSDAILWIMPSDHFIINNETLMDSMELASRAAVDGHIVTFGMNPTKAETGYGYIKSGVAVDGFDGISKIQNFVEKPNATTAQEYLNSGEYTWNSGMFVASVKTLVSNFKEFSPLMAQKFSQEIKENRKVSPKTYSQVEAVPFDTAIMEKTSNGAVIKCDMGWNDVGTWESIWNIKNKDENGNVFVGAKGFQEDSHNCYIHSTDLTIAALGLKDIIVVENTDSVLIADKNNVESMKMLISKIDKANHNLMEFAPHENRPWGEFKVLSESEGYKVKELTIIPGGKLSLQMHHHRTEFWTVIEGHPTITINGETKTLSPQKTAHVPMKAVHRIENKTDKPVIIIEVQCGSYLGEDDIVRFNDIYGRDNVAEA